MSVNSSTLALGVLDVAVGGEVVSLVRLDGEVPESILEPIREIKAITKARLLKLD
jgi:hypothetical protein